VYGWTRAGGFGKAGHVLGLRQDIIISVTSHSLSREREEYSRRVGEQAPGAALICCRVYYYYHSLESSL
jgi:hypothetical protein